jgi:hypothetical protein
VLYPLSYGRVGEQNTLVYQRLRTALGDVVRRPPWGRSWRFLGIRPTNTVFKAIAGPATLRNANQAEG